MEHQHVVVEREAQLGVGVSPCWELHNCLYSARQLTLLSLSNITGQNVNINTVPIIRLKSSADWAVTPHWLSIPGLLSITSHLLYPLLQSYFLVNFLLGCVYCSALKIVYLSQSYYHFAIFFIPSMTLSVILCMTSGCYARLKLPVENNIQF